MLERLNRIPKFWRLVVIASVLSFVICLIQIASQAPYTQVWGDAYYYHHGANLLADGKGYILAVDYLMNGVVTQAADHPPLYLTYLAFFSFIGLKSIVVHLVATVLLVAASVPFVAMLGRRLGGEKVGVATAFIFAIHPGIWSWSHQAHSEAAALLSLVIMLVIGFHVLDAVRAGVCTTKHLILMGVSIGVAAMCRAELLLCGAIIGIIATASIPIRPYFKRLVLTGIVALLVITPWVGYNLSRFNKPVFLSDGAGITLANSNCDETYSGVLNAYWYLGCLNQHVAEFKELNPDADRSELVDYVGAKARTYIREHLGEVPRVVVQRIGRAFGFYRPGQQMDLDDFPEGRTPVGVNSAWAAYYLLLPFSISGAVLLRKRRQELLILLAPLATAVLAIASTFGSTRYRFGAEPTLILFASMSICFVIAKITTRGGAQVPDERVSQLS